MVLSDGTAIKPLSVKLGHYPIFDQRDDRTVTCTFMDTKLQFFDASSQRLLEPTIPVGVLGVASVAHILRRIAR